MRTIRSNSQVLFLLLLLTMLGSCSPESEQAAPVPPPGTMTILSIEAVNEERGAELIPNGDFREWYGGLDFPTGFDAPANRDTSRVERGAMLGHLNTTGYTARQTWDAFDINEAPQSCFGTTLQLDSDQVYELSVVASATAGMVATVGAYEIDSAGSCVRLPGDVIEVSEETPVRYTGSFRTRNGGPVFLRAKASPTATLPGNLTWSMWSVRAVNEVREDVAVADSRYRWLERSLDQIRQQFQLYGGVDAWSTALFDIYSNFGRVIAESEEQPGPAILGYDQYVFQEIDLAYSRNVSSLVSYVEEGRPVYRPAFRALVDLDRTLRKRDINLVLVPLPDRIHLLAEKVHKPAAKLPPAWLPHTLLVEALLDQGVLAIDVAPLLKDRLAAEMPVYWRTDYGVPSYTLYEIARYIAPITSEFAGGTGNVGYSLVKTDTALIQRAVPGLPPRLQDTIAPENRTRYEVHDETGNPVVPVAASPILVVGSMAHVYEDEGASLAAHIALETGNPVSVLPNSLGDQEVARHLMEDDVPALNTAKVVIFCIPEYAFVRPGW